MFFSNLLNTSDTKQPTIFELSMASSLSTSLQPGFDYALAVLAQEGLGSWSMSAYKFRDEVFLGLMILVERHHLQQYGGSFAENFYGLKRVMTSGAPLSPLLKLTSLVELTLIPYLLRKLITKIREAESRQRNTTTTAAEEDILILKPLLGLYELIHLGFQLTFLFGKSEFYTPLQWIQRIIVTRVTPSDLQKAPTVANDYWNQASMLQKGIYVLQRTLHWSFVASAVFFKLMEFYMSPENRAARESQLRKRSTIIPPPMPIPPLPQIILPARSDLCPICGQIRTNPTLSSSGYCFCYSCISQYVEQNNKCPVTGIACTTSQLRRIFTVT
jgi:peroxin-12